MLDINDSSTDAARGCNYYIRLIETAANYWMLAGIRTAQDKHISVARSLRQEPGVALVKVQ